MPTEGSTVVGRNIRVHASKCVCIVTQHEGGKTDLKKKAKNVAISKHLELRQCLRQYHVLRPFAKADFIIERSTKVRSPGEPKPILVSIYITVHLLS